MLSHVEASGTKFYRLGCVVWIPSRRLLTVNEGGYGVTITFRPWRWLRVYLYGHVMNLGGCRA